MTNINSGLRQIDENQSLIDKYELKDVLQELDRMEEILEEMSCEDDLSNKILQDIDECLEILGYVVMRLEEE